MEGFVLGIPLFIVGLIIWIPSGKKDKRYKFSKKPTWITHIASYHDSRCINYTVNAWKLAWFTIYLE
jgi:hypothetical protein